MTDGPDRSTFLADRYARKRGWETAQLPYLEDEDYASMWEWCFENLSGEIYIISRYDFDLPDGCIHEKVTRDTECLPGIQVKNVAGRQIKSGLHLYFEKSPDAVLFTLRWT